MKFFRSMLKNSIWIFVLYTFIFMLLMYSASIYTLNNEMTDLIDSEMADTASNMSDKVNSSLNLIGLFLRDNDIREHMRSVTPDYMLVTKIQQTLSSTGAFTGFSTAAVTKVSDNLVISDDQSSSLSFFLGSLGISTDTFENLTQSFSENSGQTAAYTLSQVEGKRLFTIVYHSVETRPLYFIFSFDIDSVFPPGLDENDTLILNINGQPVCANNASVSPEFMQSLGERHGYKVYNQEETFSTPFGKLSCTYAAPSLRYFSSLNRNFFIAILAGLLLLALGFLISYRITKRTYRPIIELLNDIDENYHLDRKEDELSYISNNLTAIRESNQRMKFKLEGYRTASEDKFMRKLLYNHLSPEDITNGLLEFHLTRVNSPFCVIIFEYTNYERLLDTFTKDALILAEKQVFDLFDAYFAKAEYHRILDLGKDRFVLILAAGSPNMLPAQIKTVLSDIELKMNIELIASIGCAVPTIKYIDRSFSEAAYVSHQRIFQIQNSSVCRLEDIRSAQDESLYHSTESETAVIQNIIDGNKDAAMRLLDIQLRDNFPNGITSKERLAQFGLDFSAMIMRVILGIHCRPEEVFPEGTNILRELRECSDVPRLRTKIEWILDSIIAHLEAQKNTLDDQIKENMTTFVKENYTKDISLYDLANYLNVSLVHASRLFKKLVGENFKDYLSYFRFQKAKKLMDQYPTRKLQDIAELTGFSNRDALKRMFLKHEGVTPSEYLKNK